MSTVENYDYAVDVMSVLLWQYNDAVRLQKLVELKQLWYDTNQDQFWTDWQRDVFDLRTANQFGLAVWAIILDIPLTFSVGPSPVEKVGWGFGQYRKNFNNGNFNRRSATDNPLTDEQSRLVLRLRYFQLITTGSVVEINRFLGELFYDAFGLVYVRDNLDMTATYIFTFYPSNQFQTVLNNFDLLPRPAGVKINYDIIPSGSPWFGFENHPNFDNGGLFDAGPEIFLLATETGELIFGEGFAIEV